MNDKPSGENDAPRHEDAIEPLPGEPGMPKVAVPRRVSVSRKGLLAAVTLVLVLAAVAGFSIARFASSDGEPADPKLRATQTPAAVNAEPRQINVPVPPMPAAVASVPQPRIPAIEPGPEDARPIGVRRNGSSGGSGSRPAPLPEDAPVMLVTSRPQGQAAESEPPPSPTGEAGREDPLASTRRNLQGYRQQLNGLLDNLARSTRAVTQGRSADVSAPPALPSGAGLLPPDGPSAVGPGLFGGQLPESATPKVSAARLGDRSLTLPKGTAFTCALKTKVISATSGLVGCQVQRHVYSDDGRVLLIERGSHLDGEYRVASSKPGTVRIPVLWTRIRTPLGVTVDIDSAGTGPLGESGIPGYVDNRWGERLGAAMMLSLIDDAVQIVIANQQSGTDADTVVLPGTTANTSKLAEKVLESTINIPPLIYQNQGGLVGIYVSRDVDFSRVYELQPVGPSR